MPKAIRSLKRKWNSTLNICDDDDDQIREEEQRCSKSTMSSSSNVDLPYDIIINEIILRLPAKSLFRFRLVSKYWFHCITDPKFVKMHLNFQAMNKPPLLMMRMSCSRPLCQVRLDDDENENGGDLLLHQLQQQKQQQKQQQQERKSVQFWGSSNGLVCLQCRDNIVCLWNPCTKESKQLPYRSVRVPPYRSGITSSTTCFGFGHGSTSTTDDYKVIRNVGYYYYNFKFRHTLVEVYTLRTNSWKVIGEYPYEVAQYQIGVYVNGGGVYWLGRTRTRTQSIDMIICFDIVNEDYREISCPPCVLNLIKTVDPIGCDRDKPYKFVALTELKGFLCITNPIVDQKCLEVWALMNKEEEESNWSKLFTIREPIIALSNQYSSFKLLGNYKNTVDEILVLVDKKELLLYNPKNDKTRALIQMDANKFKEVQTCIDSLVSLNSGTYNIL